MQGVSFVDAEFIIGASSLEGLPEDGLPEVAFVGRSNVGKFTLIKNRVTRRRNLARTSSTPGRTQQLNYFSISATVPEEGKQRLYLVDLPGFGYAKFSKEKREILSRLTVDYLQNREELAVVCLLNDCRRMPEGDELAVRDLVFEAGKHLLVIATKIDKVKKSARKAALEKLASAYGLEASDIVLEGEKLGPSNLPARIALLVA